MGSDNSQTRRFSQYFGSLLILTEFAMGFDLHKYNEALGYLFKLITKNIWNAEIKLVFFKATRRIKSDKNRDETRSWTRTKRTA